MRQVMDDKDKRKQRYNKRKSNKKNQLFERKERIKKIKVKDNNNKVIFYDPTIEDDTELFL